jgi:sugar phosphate isomerase/epimerase
MPFHLLKERHLPMVLREGINPEISFNHATLDRYGRDDFRTVAGELRAAALSVTFHAPFLDLRPGALDPKIRQASVDRLRQVLDLVPLFAPRSVVCHPSFDKRYYVSGEKLWLENSIDTWQRLARCLEGTATMLALENVYETDPEQLALLLSALPSPPVGFCFDTGHFNAFARTPLPLWLEKLLPFLGQLHIHDNDGTSDAHLPVGDGTFPFAAFFATLRERGAAPLVTIEAHSEADLWRSLGNLRSFELPAAAATGAGGGRG